MPVHFWSADPAATAQLCRALCPTAVRRTLEIAEDLCRHRFLFRDHWEMERTHEPVQFGPKVTEIDWACIPAGDPEWLYAMNRHSGFVHLGKAWHYTGEERYAQKFAELIADWIERVPLTPQSKNDTWRSLEAGLRCENWLRALALLDKSPALTDRLLQKIEACLRIHGEYLVESHNDFHRLSNWGILQDHGLFLLGLYFERQDWQETALCRLAETLHHSVMADGSQWEQSPMYHCEVLHCVMDTVLAARRCGVRLPDRFEATVHRMCRALAAWCKPDGRLICQSDSDDTDARDLLALGAVLFEDAALRGAAGPKLFEENLWDLGADAPGLYAALPVQPAVPCSTLLPDSGNAVLRGADGAWVHMHCGCLGSGHGHADLLHIDAGIDGEDVLIDSGRYTYVDGPLRRQFKLPAAHNTTRVDGADFSSCVDSWGYDRLAIPIKGEHTFTDTADYASGLHLGYLDRGVVAARRLVFLRRQGLLVVFDEFFGRGCHQYEQNFHFGPGEIIQNGPSLHWRGNRAAARLLCLGPDLTLQRDRRFFSRDYNALQEGETLTVQREGKDFGWFVSVLSMDANAPDGAAPVEAELLPVEKLRQRTVLPDNAAQAVRIRKAGRETVLLCCHAEVISEVDLLAAGGYSGYGKMLVFTPEMPQGLCLAW